MHKVPAFFDHPTRAVDGRHYTREAGSHVILCLHTVESDDNLAFLDFVPNFDRDVHDLTVHRCFDSTFRCARAVSAQREKPFWRRDDKGGFMASAEYMKALHGIGIR